MTDQHLGPKPEPEIEPGEPHPGGVDAVDAADDVDDATAAPAPTPHDPDPDENPAVDDVLPEEMREGEDTETEATKSDSGDVRVEQDKESPA